MHAFSSGQQVKLQNSLQRSTRNTPRLSCQPRKAQLESWLKQFCAVSKVLATEIRLNYKPRLFQPTLVFYLYDNKVAVQNCRNQSECFFQWRLAILATLRVVRPPRRRNGHKFAHKLGFWRIRAWAAFINVVSGERKFIWLLVSGGVSASRGFW